MSSITKIKPQVRMVGEDGNAFAILARCNRACRDYWSSADWESFKTEATSGDHDHLLCTMMKWFDADGCDRGGVVTRPCCASIDNDQHDPDCPKS